MTESLKSRIIRGDVLIGAIITLPSTETAEILSQSGYDWFFIDLEHTTLTIKDAQHILQTVSHKVPCLIRVAANEEVCIKQALDIGAAGIIVPSVKSEEDARKAVRFCNYPPDGCRSVGVARAHGYGGNFENYIGKANDDTIIIMQIEHIEAVGNIQQISNVKGYDGIFIGPYDLSASMGRFGLTDDFAVQKAIRQVQKYAESANIPLGIFGSSPENLKSYIDNGYILIASGMDTMLFEQAVRNNRDAFRS